MEPTQAGDSSLSEIRRKYGKAADPTVELPSGSTPHADDAPNAEPSQRFGAPGARASRYIPGRLLGRGGMAYVFEARDEDLHRIVAMKVLALPPHDSDAVAVARFLEEAQVTGQLDHPAIVPVHDLGMDRDERVFFTMRRVRGRDFKEILRLVHQEKEGWTLPRAVGVIVRVCEAMAFAHAKGVVHRDLKPTNLMVGAFGEVYVMDWGLAKVRGRTTVPAPRPRLDGSITLSEVHTDRTRAVEESPDSALVTMDGTVIGTPSYMSPEQARGRLGEVDQKSDIYSVGAILYHLLAGEAPYVPRGAKVSPRTVLAAAIQGPPKPVHRVRPDLPEELCAICEKAMAWDRNRRYPSMREMAVDLQAFLEGRVVQAHRTGAVAEFRKWVGRNRGEAIAIAASIVILLGAAMGFALQQSRHALETSRQNKELSRLNEAVLAEKRGADAARSNEERARREAERTAELLQRQLDERLIAERIAARESLWPAVAATVPAMRRWLEETDTLLARRERHRDALDSGPVEDDGDRTFLSRLLAGFAQLDTVREEVVHWMDEAENLERITLVDARSDWARAIRDIAASETYAHLELEPQLGLVPLRKNPATGLWEFLHVASGTAPALAPTPEDPGHLRLEPETGVVFVLLPPGTFDMGSSPLDSGGPNPDRDHNPDEEPVTRVQLDAFFLSKYELTQAVWERVLGVNPSYWHPGAYEEIPVTTLHPVEGVSWLDCREFLRRMDLELPTEAQWEYACRAGTATPWASGDTVESLQGYANLGDADYYADLAPALKSSMTYTASIHDGHKIHAPVGSFLPNRFGLYDMHGNVWEWCADVKLEYGIPTRPGDGLREGSEMERERVIRGGGWGMVAEQVRSAQRLGQDREARQMGVGFRPARAVR